jgi:hypothetical protein
MKKPIILAFVCLAPFSRAASKPNVIYIVSSIDKFNFLVNR